MKIAPQPPRERLDRETVLGLTGVLAWLASSAVVGYAHDMIVAKYEPVTVWSTVYEFAAGYVLGFVGTLSASIVVQLGRGPVPELMLRGRWLRSLAMMCLLAVLAISLAGLVMQNLGGPTFTYDIAYVIGVLLTVFGVLPLYRRVRDLP